MKEEWKVRVSMRDRVLDHKVLEKKDTTRWISRRAFILRLTFVFMRNEYLFYGITKKIWEIQNLTMKWKFEGRLLNFIG